MYDVSFYMYGVSFCMNDVSFCMYDMIPLGSCHCKRKRVNHIDMHQKDQDVAEAHRSPPHTPPTRLESYSRACEGRC